MASNLKFLCDPTSDIVDATVDRNMIGSYLTNMRLDNYFTVKIFDLGHGHMITTKHVMGYLKGTSDFDLKHASNSEIILHGYVDSYLSCSVEDRKST